MYHMFIAFRLFSILKTNKKNIIILGFSSRAKLYVERDMEMEIFSVKNKIVNTHKMGPWAHFEGC